MLQSCRIGAVHRILIYAGTLAIAGGASAGDFPGFTSPQTYVTGSLPTDLEPGLIDTDAIPDLVVVNRHSATLSVLRGLGDGSFEALSTTQTLSAAESLALGDFNRDGRPDAAVVSNASGDLAIHLNNGEGALVLNDVIDVDVASSWVKAADFDNDGNIDLVVCHRYEESRVSLLLGNGDGTFRTPQVISIDGSPVNIDLHDVNGDGLTDLGLSVLRVGTGYLLEVLLNDGAGGFASPIDSPAPQRTVTDLSFGDLDSDGIADCATSNNEGSATVWRGIGDGSFTFMGNLFTNGLPRSVEIVDLNDDGANDVLVVDLYLHRVNAIVGDGAGNFAPHRFFTIADRPTSMVAADFDGDDVPEVAVTHEFDSSQIVSVLRNMTLPGDSAALVNAEAAVGEILFGAVGDLDLPGQGELLIRSGFGETLVDLHHLDLRISAVTNVPNPSVFNLGLLTHINQNAGIEQLRFLNWSTGRFESVAQYQATNDMVLIEGIDATDFVSTDGEIVMSFKQIVFVPFVAFQFHNFMQWVDIAVE